MFQGVWLGFAYHDVVKHGSTGAAGFDDPVPLGQTGWPSGDVSTASQGSSPQLKHCLDASQCKSACPWDVNMIPMEHIYV